MSLRFLATIKSKSTFFLTRLAIPPTRKTLPFGSRMSSWDCSNCTFTNPASQKDACVMCLSKQSKSNSPTISANPKWSCQACTFLNKFGVGDCEICGTRASTLANDDELDGLGSSVGDVFFPLRACSSSISNNQNKRKSREISDGDDVDVSDNQSKRKSREIYGGDDDVSDSRGGFRDLKAPKEEVISVGGITSCSGDSGGGFRDLKAPKEEVIPVECSTAKDGLSKGTRSLKILSYNVWFREDLEMQARMDAIGDLILQHSPDIMCFQEVTLDSYEMFRKSGWWKLYQCSVSKTAIEHSYFCMQLCKLPVKRYSCIPFSYSAMGRELCVAEVDVRYDKPLVVATSHLESPCPGPPTWDQMFSKERVGQAKEAIKLLEKHPNVIFCGDMNWDDKLDGQFPMPDGWFDAWMKLRPQEEGLTYDTKSNKMLKENRSLRKRLDRFICNLKDFKLSEIEMIGMEELPGLSYCKEKKVKGQVKKIMLPVLPSDHYGLLLTITLK